MNLKNSFCTIRRILFPVNLDTIFSEESKEQTALGIASRHSTNPNVRAGRIFTRRMFDEQMNRLALKVVSTKNR